MLDAPLENVTVKVRGRDVILDPNNMKFNEATLSEYMDREYGWIDYFGKQLEFAHKEMLDAEVDYDALYAKKYVSAKDLGGTENYAKCVAASDDDVVKARKKVKECKETVGLLKAHLKAWDKNHDNAQNRGHTLRKERDKLNNNVIYQQEESTCSAEDFLK